MGTHPIFESDFDCLTEHFVTELKKMSGKKLSFAENFALSGCAAIVSKTAAAPLACQASHPKSGRNAQTRQIGTCLCWCHRLHQTYPGRGGSWIILAWKPCQLYPLLPDTSTQLCLQGQNQGHVCHP